MPTTEEQNPEIRYFLHESFQADPKNYQSKGISRLAIQLHEKYNIPVKEALKKVLNARDEESEIEEYKVTRLEA